MRALGFDPGTTRRNPVGVALVAWPLDEERPALLGAAQLQPGTSEALADFLGRLGARLRGDWLNGVEIVGVEWPYVGENAQSALDLAACCGVALAAAGERGLRAYQLSPSEAKVALAGHGGADKDAMMAAARSRFGRQLPKDQADAVGIALAALVKARHYEQLKLRSM